MTNHAITVVQQTLNDVSEHTTRKKITKNEWNHVLESIENVPVGEVSSLASPTTLRTSDAARASTLSITDVKGKTYSHTFDNENPNEKLQPLMKCIVMMEEHLKN